MHSHNIIHRDIKPGNILIFDIDRLKLADFGFTKVIDPNVLNNTHVGTHGYLAPEINANSPTYYPGTDIWSLGMVLHDMIYGEDKPPILPFNVDLTKTKPYSNGEWV
jgi:serine/threonine protein kinase